jgi:uncharacterized membrane protein YkoI
VALVQAEDDTMKRLLSGFATLVIAGIANSAAPPYQRDMPATLVAEARISEEAALATALSVVPRGEVVSVELERENGKLLYSVDIKTPGKRGVEEVHVSALDGHLLSREHESAKAEVKEAAAEKREAARKPHR